MMSRTRLRSSIEPTVLLREEYLALNHRYTLHALEYSLGAPVITAETAAYEEVHVGLVGLAAYLEIIVRSSKTKS